MILSYQSGSAFAKRTQAMMRSGLVLLLLVGCVQGAAASPSQIRGATQSWEEAAANYESHLDPSEDEGLTHRIPREATARGSAVSFKSLKLSDIPRWEVSSTGREIQAEFERTRDLRFLTIPEMPDFLRRVSWLYPDDGCYMRAEKIGEELEKSRLPRPKKLFVFGDLSVKTGNSPEGWVFWWYHVAPVIYRQVQGSSNAEPNPDNAFVFDPAIEPKRPLRLKEWVERMVAEVGDAKLAICDPTAYGPSSPCAKPTSNAAERANRDSPKFLRAEWYRLEAMERNPRRELGNFPPWGVVKPAESAKLEESGTFEAFLTDPRTSAPGV